jgi:uracil permease
MKKQIEVEERLPILQTIPLSLQHLFAMFGATVMARMSLLIGRIYFLLHDWLHLAK